MSLDPALEELMPDEITIEPFSSAGVTQASTFGSAVTYRAQVTQDYRRSIGADGREVMSKVRVLIAGRVSIDPRSRITLPSGYSTISQPPIISVSQVGGVPWMNMDSTEILCG